MSLKSKKSNQEDSIHYQKRSNTDLQWISQKMSKVRSTELLNHILQQLYYYQMTEQKVVCKTWLRTINKVQLRLKNSYSLTHKSMFENISNTNNIGLILIQNSQIQSQIDNEYGNNEIIEKSDVLNFDKIQELNNSDTDGELLLTTIEKSLLQFFCKSHLVLMNYLYDRVLQQIIENCQSLKYIFVDCISKTFLESMDSQQMLKSLRIINQNNFIDECYNDQLTIIKNQIAKQQNHPIKMKFIVQEFCEQLITNQFIDDQRFILEIIQMQAINFDPTIFEKTIEIIEPVIRKQFKDQNSEQVDNKILRTIEILHLKGCSQMLVKQQLCSLKIHDTLEFELQYYLIRNDLFGFQQLLQFIFTTKPHYQFQIQDFVEYIKNKKQHLLQGFQTQQHILVKMNKSLMLPYYSMKLDVCFNEFEKFDHQENLNPERKQCQEKPYTLTLILKTRYSRHQRIFKIGSENSISTLCDLTKHLFQKKEHKSQVSLDNFKLCPNTPALGSLNFKITTLGSIFNDIPDLIIYLNQNIRGYNKTQLVQLVNVEYAHVDKEIKVIEFYTNLMYSLDDEQLSSPNDIELVF